MGRYTAEILQNAQKINEIHARLKETYNSRHGSEKIRNEWEQLSSSFWAQHNSLAFPGGADGANERILAGDPDAMEAAICFLECRPYFFRSGYMWQGFLKKAKKAPLTDGQKVRLDRVVTAYDEYRKSRKSS